MELTIRQQREQKRAGIGAGPNAPKISRLTAALKTKLATNDIEIVTLTPDHLVFVSHDQLGRPAFTRCDYVLGDPPLVTFSNFEATTNAKPDHIRMPLFPEFSLEQKAFQMRRAGLLVESKALGIPAIGNGSFEDFKNALHIALDMQFGGKETYIYIVAMYTAKVCIHVEGRGKSEHYEIPYTVRSGQFDFGTPVRVVKKTTFVKAQEAKRYQQRLGGVKTDNDNRLELRESMFDPGGVTVLHPEILLEGKSRSPMTIQGVAARAGVTGNGRFYSKDFWKTIVEKSQPKIKASRFLGELDHPMPEGSYGRLNSTGVLHKKLYMDGDFVRFESEVLETRAGETLKALLNGGVSVGASTRVFANTRRGKVDGQTVEIVEADDADFAGIDFVSEAAVREAEIQNFQ